MEPKQPNNSLHGVTLKMMLETLIVQYGFDFLARSIAIKCFTHNPSLKSSLTFLRKTPWARAKLEKLYLEVIQE